MTTTATSSRIRHTAYASDDDKTEIRDRLWQAILAKVDEIKTATTDPRGTRRSEAFYGVRGDTCASWYEIGRPDGTTDVHIIQARWNNSTCAPDVTVDRSYHSSEPFWEQQLANRDRAIVVDGHHYRLGNERRQGSRGFGGRRHVIEDIATRQRTVSTNLWYQGVIPPKYRDLLPDTHRFDADLSATPESTGSTP